MQSYGDSLDLLVIQVDASVASNPEINLEQPCPPASNTTNALRNLVVEWIGGQVPEGVVVVVPSKTSDAWVCAAVVGGDELIECDPEPLERLAGVDGLGFRLKQTSDGKVKKPTARQFAIHLAPKVADNFAQVRDICSEAELFALEVEAQCTQEWR